jgi:hypothetical protein
MHRFERNRPPKRNEVPVSIKIRIVSGCFHREHSPRAYEIIDSKLAKLSRNLILGFEEHESGPELLVYVAVATAGVTLAASVINLVTAIIKARSEGVKKGDRPDEPIELIVRRVDDRAGLREETILRVGAGDRCRFPGRRQETNRVA